jgi:hypothetical protein
MGRSRVTAPPPRDYKQEMLDAMLAQEAIQPRLLALEQQYTPLYQQLQEKGIGGGVETMGRLFGQAQGISAGLQSGYLGMQAPIYGQVGQAALGAYQQSLDPQTRGIYASMMSSAQRDLDAGRGLTPEMEKFAQQSARQAMAARGLSGNQAVGQEVLNTYQLGQMREDRARQYGAGMYAAGLAQTQSANAMYGMPLMQQMAAMSPAGLVQGGSSLYSGMGAQIFQPESQYNAQLITANRQEQMQAQLANQQAKAGMIGGLMKMGGAIIGGMATGGTGFFAKAAAGSALSGSGGVGAVWNPETLMHEPK